MKKLFYPLACVLICTTSPAHAKKYFSGIFLTGGIGATSAQYTVNQQLSTTFASPPILIDMPDNIDLSAGSAAIMVSLGYSYQFINNIVLGGAFTAGYTHAQISDNIANLITTSSQQVILAYDSKMEITLNNDFALLFKPGYVFGTTTFFYGLVGPRWGNFKSSVKTDLFILNGTDEFTGSGSNSQSNYELGITLGLGIQQLISPNYSWALEYAYTDYGDIDSPSTTGTISKNGIPQSGDTFTDSPSIKANTNTLMFTASVRY